jgi:hypothetical protein
VTGLSCPGYAECTTEDLAMQSNLAGSQFFWYVLTSAQRKEERAGTDIINVDMYDEVLCIA